MRPGYVVPLCFGFLLVYLGAFGLNGFGVSFHLHGLSLNNNYGQWNFVDAEFQGGSYTDYKVTISTCKILSYPSSADYVDAAGWFGAYIGGHFVQAGWFSDLEVHADLQDKSPWAFWSDEEQNFSLMIIKQISYGDTHTYELKQQSGGSWVILCDSTIATTVPYTGTCNEVQAVLETFCNKGDPGQLDVGQTIFTNMYVTSGGQTWPFLQPTTSYGSFGVSIDTGNNGIEFNSPTGLTEGWGLPTGQISKLPTNFQNVATQYDLKVYSAYGAPTPNVGDHQLDSGSSITCSVATSSGSYTCTGWTGTGSVPASGSSNSVTFTITQDSTITWNWQLSTSHNSNNNTNTNTNTNIPSLIINVDWNTVWNDLSTLVAENQEPILFLGGLISLFSFIGLMLPQKRMHASW